MPPPTTALDMDRVKDVEMALVVGATRDELLREGFTDMEVSAGETRRRFSQLGEREGDLLDAAFWKQVVGVDNFGMLQLEVDGSITISYVLNLPNIEDLPSGFVYRFEKTELPYDKALAQNQQQDEDNLVSKPSDPHNALRAGQTGVWTCKDATGTGSSLYFVGYPKHPVLTGTGLQSAATVTGTVTFTTEQDISAGQRRFAALTAGHEVWGRPATAPCKDTTAYAEETDPQHVGPRAPIYDAHVWLGRINFPVEPSISSCKNVWDTDVTWWNSSGNFEVTCPLVVNTKGRGDGRAGFATNRSVNGQRVDVGMLRRIGASKTTVHLDPAEDGIALPAAWKKHTTTFGDLLQPVSGTLACTALGNSGTGTPVTSPGTQGDGVVDCGVFFWTNSEWRMHLEHDGDDVQDGDSGAPVFTFADTPRPLGMVTETEPQNSYELQFQSIFHMLRELGSEYWDGVFNVEFCVESGASAAVLDRAYNC